MDQPWVVDFYSDEDWVSTLQYGPEFDLLTFLLSHTNLPKAVFDMILREEA